MLSRAARLQTRIPPHEGSGWYEVPCCLGHLLRSYSCYPRGDVGLGFPKKDPTQLLLIRGILQVKGPLLTPLSLPWVFLPHI